MSTNEITIDGKPIEITLSEDKDLLFDGELLAAKNWTGEQQILVAKQLVHLSQQIAKDNAGEGWESPETAVNNPSDIAVSVDDQNPAILNAIASHIVELTRNPDIVVSKEDTEFLSSSEVLFTTLELSEVQRKMIADPDEHEDSGELNDKD